MTAFLITYDLNTPGQEYEPLYEAIRALGKWWHYLDSTWIVISNKTAEEIYQKLKPCFDEGDFFFVVAISGADRQGWLKQKAWAWIQENV